MPYLDIDTEEVRKKKDVSKDFVEVLQNSLFECGKRRTTFTYLFAALGTFFLLCDYFGVNKISFLGSEFTFDRGHLYWGALAVLSIIYLYDVFLLFHEVNILWVVEASYHALGLPKTFLNDQVLAMSLYPSPLSYTVLVSLRGDKRILNYLVGASILLLNLVGPLALLVYFGYKGIRSLGFLRMLIPFIIVIMCILVLIRAFVYAGGTYRNLPDEDK